MKMNHTFYEKACVLYTGVSLFVAIVAKFGFANATVAKVAFIFAIGNIAVKLLLELARYHYLMHFNKKS